jgi:hypothetical protein
MWTTLVGILERALKDRPRKSLAAAAMNLRHSMHYCHANWLAYDTYRKSLSNSELDSLRPVEDQLLVIRKRYFKAIRSRQGNLASARFNSARDEYSAASASYWAEHQKLGGRRSPSLLRLEHAWATSILELLRSIEEISEVLQVFDRDAFRAVHEYAGDEVDTYEDAVQAFKATAAAIGDKRATAPSRDEVDPDFEQALQKLDTFLSKQLKPEEIHSRRKPSAAA